MHRLRNPAFIATLALASYTVVAAPAAATTAATGAGIDSATSKTLGINPRQHGQRHAGGPNPNPNPKNSGTC
jgi:hypothetical protein